MKMVEIVWACSSCLHKTKRKANIIRHIKLIHGIDIRTIENSEKDVGVNTTNVDSTEYKTSRFCCDKCLYNTVKKYNLMRHLKRLHTPKETFQQEDQPERYYTWKEFEEIMTRPETSIQSSLKDCDKPNSVKAVRVEVVKPEAKMRKGYLQFWTILHNDPHRSETATDCTNVIIKNSGRLQTTD